MTGANPGFCLKGHELIAGVTASTYWMPLGGKRLMCKTCRDQRIADERDARAAVRAVESSPVFVDHASQCVPGAAMCSDCTDLWLEVMETAVVGEEAGK